MVSEAIYMQYSKGKSMHVGDYNRRHQQQPNAGWQKATKGRCRSCCIDEISSSLLQNGKAELQQTLLSWLESFLRGEVGAAGAVG